MPIEVLHKLKSLREEIAEALRSDPRTLTMSALDRSIAEIGDVLATSGVIPHGHGSAPTPLRFTPEAIAAPNPAPTDRPSDGGTLDQIRALRGAIAEEIRKDPRYLTLGALDRSIAEIGGVLEGARPTSAPPSAGIATEAMGRPLGHAATTAAAPSPASEADSSEDPEPAAHPGFHAAEPVTNEPIEAAPDTSTPDRHYAIEPGESAAVHPMETESPLLAAPPAATRVELDPVQDPLDPVQDPLDPVHEPLAEIEPFTSAEHGSHTADAVAAPAADLAEPIREPSEHEPSAHEAAAHEAVLAALSGVGAETIAEPIAVETHAESHETSAAEPAAADSVAAGVSPGAEVAQNGRGSGYAPMEARPGAAHYIPALSVKFGRLPNVVDLRPMMRPVSDQNEIKSCVADAVTGALECWSGRMMRQEQALSRLFVYWNARWRDVAQDEDDGAAIQPAMEGLAKFGACPEQAWPFDGHLTLKRPGADAYREAAAHRVHDMAQVPLRIESWKQALAEGRPIVFGIVLFSSFDECSERGGIVPMPPPEDLAQSAHGFHAMCAVGYCESEKVFIVRNCWGPDWCDGGYCYMPFAYVLNPKFNDGDCWVFTTKGMNQVPREAWSDASDPVTNGGRGVDFPIESHSIADYGNVAVDFYEAIRLPYNDVPPAEYSAYAAASGKGRFAEMETFDVGTYLAVAGALTGSFEDELQE